MGDWPGNSAAIDAEWLDNVLRRNGVLSGAKVSNVTAANLGVGVGIMGEVSRLSIGYDKAEPGAPSSIIAKFRRPIRSISASPACSSSIRARWPSLRSSRSTRRSARPVCFTPTST